MSRKQAYPRIDVFVFRRIEETLSNGINERALVVYDVQNVGEVPLRLMIDHQRYLRGSSRFANLIQLVCRPLALEMEPESESDGMRQGLYGI